MSDQIKEKSAKNFLSAADIRNRARPSHPPVEVEVPEWGGSVHVRRLSVAGIDKYYSTLKAAPDDRARATILTVALCDVAGVPLYSPTDAVDLAELDAAGADRVVEAFFVANGLGGRRGN